MSLVLIRSEYINLSSEEDEEENEEEIFWGNNEAVVKRKPCDEHETITDILEDIIGKVVVTVENGKKGHHKDKNETNKDKNSKEGEEMGRNVERKEPFQLQTENVLDKLERNEEIHLKEENLAEFAGEDDLPSVSMEELNSLKSLIESTDQQWQSPLDVMMPTFSEEDEDTPENRDDKTPRGLPLPKRKGARLPTRLSNRVNTKRIREMSLESSGTRKTKVVRMSRRLEVKRQQNVSEKSLPFDSIDLQGKKNQKWMRSEKTKMKAENSPKLPKTGGTKKKNGAEQENIYNCPFCDMINMEDTFFIKHLDTHKKLSEKRSQTKAHTNATFKSSIKGKSSLPVSPLRLEEQAYSPEMSHVRNPQRRNRSFNKSQPAGKAMKAVQLSKLIKKRESTQSPITKDIKSSAIDLPHCSVLLKRCDHLLLLPKYHRNQFSHDVKTGPQISNPKSTTKSAKRMQETCPECKKTFKRKDHLKIHYRVHSGEKPFKCTHCPKRFLQQSGLINHNRIHSGEKPFKCTQCSKRFTKKSNLTSHSRIHSNDKPFKCPHCSFESRWERNLKRHIANIHDKKKK